MGATREEERMEGNLKIESLFRDYCEEVAKLTKEARPFAGMFGFGSGPKDDPCHARFVEAVNREAARQAEDKVPAEEAKQTVGLLLSLQQSCDREGLVYWTCMAVHGAALPLIPLLHPEDAKEICDAYAKALPRRMRMPLQERVMKALAARAKET